MQLRMVEALGLGEKMTKSQTVLKAFGNAIIQTVGRLEAILEMGGESYPVDFMVIEEGLKVLERSDIERLKLMSWNAELGNQLSNCDINKMYYFFILIMLKYIKRGRKIGTKFKKKNC